MTEPDDDLGVLLGRSIDRLPTADADAALVAVTSRSRVRRRRRAAARMGAVVAAVAAATAVWLMVYPPDRSEVHIVDGTGRIVVGTSVVAGVVVGADGDGGLVTTVGDVAGESTMCTSDRSGG